MRDTRRARLVLGLLLAAALVLITVDHRQREDSLFEPVRTAASSLFGVAEEAGTGVVRPVGEFIDTFSSAPEYKRQITALRAENARLRRELTAGTLDRRRSAELSSMLGLSGLGGYRVVAAQVIARRGVPGFEDTVEIDAGRDDGVRAEMTVLNGDGLVGRVVRTGPSTSTVVLLTDPASTAGARLEGGNQIGVITGLGPAAEGRYVRFRLLDATSSLSVGRRIVSFGSQHGMPYAPGLPVGTIERVEPTPGELTRVAYARPYVDFAALDVVGVVVRAPQRDPRDAMLPPSPPPKAVKARATAPARPPAAQESDARTAPPSGAPGTPGTSAERPAEPSAEPSSSSRSSPGRQVRGEDGAGEQGGDGQGANGRRTGERDGGE
ncbi:rod shape-determining protein MreC [Sphaerisporangium melleum]|uniref:Cell shape-determining protein MreC n=1 Tax=Sphaerisporangium melleum TaxID=321316 RepID=A0A917RCW8_9ACTN|nr:rod shape-determining protein MreC [Sphaerisporangium melleum]GGL00486.1 rod shape-determining protein MreC [Sphaerisporangium melleum]GII71207.1 rod shape-determining protein MreC [Sphaerisporangium melleum]